MTNADTGYYQALIDIDGINQKVSPPVVGFDYGRLIVGAITGSLACVGNSFGKYEPCPRCRCAMGHPRSEYVFRHTMSITVS
jgi:hypothetical protein